MTSLDHTPSADPFIFRFFNEIGIIDQLVSADFQKALGSGLGQSEFGVLNHLVRMGDGKTPSHLASLFQISKPSMTAIIGKLSSKGLVEVAESQADRRQKLIRLTEAGRSARNEAVARVAPIAARLNEEFDIKQLEAIYPVIQALRAYLDDARTPTLVD